MTNLRLSMTDIESYRWWRRSGTSTLADLADRLCHVDPPNERMRVGQAFEAVLFGDHLPPDLSDIEFHGTLYTPRVHARQSLLTVEFARMAGFHLTLRGRVDGLAGNEVVEVKTTWSGIDVERYEASSQWRGYLLGSGHDACRYEVYRVGVNRELGGYDVREYQPFTFRRYADIWADLREVAEETCEAVALLLREGLVDIGGLDRLMRATPPPVDELTDEEDWPAGASPPKGGA